MSPATSLTNPAALLEYVPARERGAALIRSAWRIAVTADEGKGTILRLEAADGTVVFRGDGLFLGWGAEEMTAAWEALAHSDAPPDPELAQLG